MARFDFRRGFFDGSTQSNSRLILRKNDLGNTPSRCARHINLVEQRVDFAHYRALMPNVLEREGM
jgi:hypothetical protein